MQLDLLTTLAFLPLLGSVVLVLLPRDNRNLTRSVALGFSIAVLALAIFTFFVYQAGGCPANNLPASLIPSANPSGFVFQCEHYASYFPALGSSWHVGLDGLGIAMVLMTVIVTPLAILISYEVKERVNEYMALLLLLEMGLIGLFVSLDMLFFFIFFELTLVPMYFLINIWGGEGRRNASFKFFLFAVGGSLGLLLSIQLIGQLTGTFDIPLLLANWTRGLTISGTPISVPFGVSLETVKLVALMAIGVAFMIKTPVWPFHIWLPDAMSEAPTAGMMMMFKIGAFGFLRLAVPLFPVEAQKLAPWLALLAVIGIVLGALSAYGQNDFRRLLAYSTLSHMSFVALGIAAFAAAYNTILTKTAGADPTVVVRSVTLATNGAILQTFSHTLTSAAMFLLVGVLVNKARTADLSKFGGLWGLAPAYGALLVFVGMASLGLPGLSDFVGEFQLMAGTWGVGQGLGQIYAPFVALSMIGILFAGAYTLKVIRQILQGPIREEWQGYRLEITAREMLAIAPLVVLIVLTGVYPNWILQTINSTVARIFGG
jgi:NADH-quinone oxidoreductase subunit M